MNITDFSIKIFFNQKGIDKRWTMQMNGLIVFKDFLKQNFPNLLNNLGKGENNSIEFDDYSVK